MIFLIMFLLLCAVTIIVGVFIDDVYTVRQTIATAKHPYARWRRQRPAVVIYGTANDTYQPRYKNVSFIPDVSIPSVSLDAKTIITTTPNDIGRTGLIPIIQTLHFRQSNVYFTAPPLRTITTISNMLLNYHSIHTALAARTKNGMTVLLPRRKYSSVLLHLAGICTTLIMSLLVSIATYLTFVHGQTTLLLTLMIIGAAYILIIIGMHQQLTAKQKCMYSILSPVSYVYFYYINLTGIIRCVVQLLPNRQFYLSKFWRI